MPLLSFSVADVLRAKTLEKGWRSFQIGKVESSLSKDKQSMNYIVPFVLIDAGPDLNGKEFRRYFNSKAISMMIPLILASQGKSSTEMKPEAFSFDVDSLEGCKVDGLVDTKLYEGNMQNSVEEYLPYGKSKDVADFVG